MWSFSGDNMKMNRFIFLLILFGLSVAEEANTNSGVLVTIGNRLTQTSSLLMIGKEPPSVRDFNNTSLASCDVDILENKIYMFDMLHRRILVGSNFSPSSKKDDIHFTVERTALAMTVDIAVDWVSHNIYWTDALLGAVLLQPGRQGIDKSLYTVIVQEYLQQPYSVAVDPLSGFVFWVDVATNSYKCQIERSSLTGKHRKSVLATALSKLRALALDGKRIYYTRDDFIESSDYNGHDRRHIPMWVLGMQFTDLDFFDGKIFATDETGHIHTNGTNSVTTIVGQYLCTYDRQKQQQSDAEIDSCASSGCADICVREPDGPQCLCRMGFELAANRKDCTEGFGSFHRALLINNGSHLCLLSLHDLSKSMADNNSNLECFYQHYNESEQITHVQIDMETMAIYFATQTSIYRILRSVTPAEPVQMTSKVDDSAMNGAITGLAYDWTNKQLYWSQTGPDGIYMIDVYTYDVPPKLFSDETIYPREVIVVPHTRDGPKLFWISSVGKESIIETDVISGGNRARISKLSWKNLYSPIKLQYDIRTDEIAVLSHGESHFVSYITQSGEEVSSFAILQPVSTFVLYKDLFITTAVDVNNDTRLYSKSRSALSKAPLSQVAQIKDIGAVLSLQIIDLDTMQPSYPNPCLAIDFKWSCSQICIPHGDTATCLCDIGFHLQEDNKTCLSAPVEDNFILISENSHGELYQIPLDSPLELHGIETRAKLGFLESIFYNTVTNMILRVYEHSDQVLAISIDGKQEKVVAKTDEFQGYPTKFALDPTTGYIYFVGYAEITLPKVSRYCIIGVIFPDGGSTIIYKEYFRRCFDIALYPSKGLMFWTDSTQKLLRAGMDGSNVNIIASGGRSYYAITIDYTEDYLYWSEYDKQTIFRSNLNGSDIFEFYTDYTVYPISIKALGDYLYYYGFRSIHIYRVDLKNTTDIKHFGPNAGLGSIKSFDVYSSNSSLETMPKNKACAEANGGCSHYCLPRGDGGRTCACKYGVTLQQDNKTCNGTMCPKVIPNGNLPDGCIPKVDASCVNFTCNQGYERNKMVKSLICNSSGLWNYDLSMLCIDASTDKRVLIIGVVAGGSVLVVIVSAGVILYVLYRRGKLLANFRWSKTSDISSELPSSENDLIVGDTSVAYLDHLTWLRARINQFLILDDDSDMALAGPNDRRR